MTAITTPTTPTSPEAKPTRPAPATTTLCVGLTPPAAVVVNVPFFPPPYTLVATTTSGREAMMTVVSAPVTVGAGPRWPDVHDAQAVGAPGVQPGTTAGVLCEGAGETVTVYVAVWVLPDSVTVRVKV